MALQNYNKTDWVNGTAPAINSTNLLNIEDGIDRATKAIQAIETNPYVLPSASVSTLGGVKMQIIHNSDGSVTGKIWSN